MWELPKNPRFSQEKFHKYFIFKYFVQNLAGDSADWNANCLSRQYVNEKFEEIYGAGRH